MSPSAKYWRPLMIDSVVTVFPSSLFNTNSGIEMLEGGFKINGEKWLVSLRAVNQDFQDPVLSHPFAASLRKEHQRNAFVILQKQQSKHPVMTESGEHFPSPPKVIVLLIISNKKYSLNSYYYFYSINKTMQYRPENTGIKRDSLCWAIYETRGKINQWAHQVYVYFSNQLHQSLGSKLWTKQYKIHQLVGMWRRCYRVEFWWTDETCQVLNAALSPFVQVPNPSRCHFLPGTVVIH